ncbi:hypothetical protein EC973_003668 [Apophysomyces ossiformis]|uniref:Uncharacterized protein n=1 Tax=Apophysomyces ossiformis TaxID=679940 RepID=A0A8H7BFI6_9FUNG|nr:hypothetical protein EC973_003668 [Apophysomyces ossiformis]
MNNCDAYYVFAKTLKAEGASLEGLFGLRGTGSKLLETITSFRNTLRSIQIQLQADLHGDTTIATVVEALRHCPMLINLDISGHNPVRLDQVLQRLRNLKKLTITLMEEVSVTETYGTYFRHPLCELDVKAYNIDDDVFQYLSQCCRSITSLSCEFECPQRQLITIYYPHACLRHLTVITYGGRSFALFKVTLERGTKHVQRGNIYVGKEKRGEMIENYSHWYKYGDHKFCEVSSLQHLPVEELLKNIRGPGDKLDILEAMTGKELLDAGICNHLVLIRCPYIDSMNLNRFKVSEFVGDTTGKISRLSTQWSPVKNYY